MKQNKLRILFAVLALALAALACEFNASTANISDAYMARDNQGAGRTTVFAQDEVFYCIVQLANAPDDTLVKVVWYAVNAQDTEPNLLIDQVETTGGDGIIPFNLTNNGLWPIGTYKAEIYLNGTLDRTLNFEVQ
ncbi:MAG: hypothetical protein HY867_12075 [Chloroflexi bacterium]|nr:hypothetical protein [Chloroflexota bacterium]